MSTAPKRLFLWQAPKRTWRSKLCKEMPVFLYYLIATGLGISVVLPILVSLLFGGESFSAMLQEMWSMLKLFSLLCLILISYPVFLLFMPYQVEINFKGICAPVFTRSWYNFDQFISVTLDLQIVGKPVLTYVVKNDVISLEISPEINVSELEFALKDWVGDKLKVLRAENESH